MKKPDIALTIFSVLVLSLSCFIIQSKQNIVHGQVDQGTGCKCSASTYFDEMVCVSGTLSCPNTISDSVCGCDNLTYLNSCVARANGIKSFTKGDCGSINNLSCASDAQCPLGTCPTGKTYSKFTCSNAGMCTLITFSSDPCLPASQGSDCRCPSGQFFDETACVTGTLDCSKIPADSVCSCDDLNFLNSCTARANGVKKFTKGSCGVGSSLSCTSDSQCPTGVCPNEKTYKTFTCTSGKCTSISFSVDPCFSSSGAQGTDCKCTIGNYFDGSICVKGTLDCLEPVVDPVCGCDGNNYSNSCLAKAAGVKQFAKGKCSSVSVLNCSVDGDCPLGICPHGNTYKRFTCKNEKCSNITFAVSPCLSSSSSSSSSSSGSSGQITISEHFTGVWRMQSVKCFPLTTSSSSSGSLVGVSSSGNCISCPNLNLICPKGSILVPQTCNSCARCENCRGEKIGFALCLKDGKVKGIINHSKYLDRVEVTSQKIISGNQIILTLDNPTLMSPQSGFVNSPVDLTLKLTHDKKNKEVLVGLFDNMLYLEKVRGRKVSPQGCSLTELESNCCNGVVSSSQEKSCQAGFLQSPCLYLGKPSFNACCPASFSCSVPCGLSCCNSNETCVTSDLCIGGNPFCFAPASLICQNCTAQGSCVSGKACPTGTTCSNSPDFLCLPAGCPTSL
ncbi:MAG: hypothetical protein HY094_06735 [Candidatus Melainabacteria bacterium]|nr:hypothetical protein [Candidatus Melainabacteria bacterium]